jgi:hypothetical protein
MTNIYFFTICEVKMDLHKVTESSIYHVFLTCGSIYLLVIVQCINDNKIKL